MKIALINLITKTIKPIFSLPPYKPKSNFLLETDYELNIMDLGKEFIKLGHDVTIFISDVYRPAKSIENEIPGLHVIYLRTRLSAIFIPSRFPYTPDLINIIKKEKFDIILCYDFFKLSTIQILLFSQSPSIIIWQETDKLPRFPFNLLHNSFYHTLGLICKRNIRLIVPKTQRACQFMELLDNKSLLYHRNIIWGISEDFQPGNVRAKYIEKFPINDKTKIILTVARLEEDKGIDNLIIAMVKILQKIPTCYLIIKGSGPLEKEYKELILKLQLQNKIKIISNRLSRNDLIELYQLSDVYVLPSNRDLVPFSIGEAMMSGKPIISTRNAWAEDYVTAEKTGIMVEQSNPDILSNQLIQILSDNQKLKQMGINARKIAMDNFSVKNVAKQLISAFESIK